MADFAKTQLMKYGWMEGKGLGKNENGINEALRPNLKFDTVGLGYKHTDTNAWWESAFNKAAKSINVESCSNGVTISSACIPEQTDVPSNGKDTEEEKTGFKQYISFHKTSTLCDGALIHEPESDLNKVLKDPEEIVHTQITDEELFKACGGRTAHKGARHGLKLNGKLERIAQQEKELLSKSNGSFNVNCIGASLTNNIRATVGDNVRENKEELYDDDCETDSNTSAILSLPASKTICQFKISKSSRKKQKKRINNLMQQLSMSCNISETDAVNMKKCLKRKRNNDNTAHIESHVSKDAMIEEIDDNLSQQLHSISDETGKDKKKKQKDQRRAMKLESKEIRNKNIAEIDTNSTDVHVEDELIFPFKKVMKLQKKVVDLAGKLDTFSLNEEETTIVEGKKSKKKSKKKAKKLKSQTDEKCEPSIFDAEYMKASLKRKRIEDKKAHIESDICKDALSEEIDDKHSQRSLSLSDGTEKSKRKKHKYHKRSMKLESKETKNKNIAGVDTNDTQIHVEDELIFPLKKVMRLQNKVVDLADKRDSFYLNEEEKINVERKKNKKKNKKKENRLKSETDEKREPIFSDAVNMKECTKRKRSKDKKVHIESDITKDALSEEIDDTFSQMSLSLCNETRTLNEEEPTNIQSKKSKKGGKKKGNKLKSKVSKKDKGHHKKETIKLERLTNNLLSNHYLSPETEKSWKASKTEKKLDHIVKNLMAVNLTENVSDSMTSNTKKNKLLLESGKE